ncbi:unnamed protein product [Coregonus sp. 'balchen']|nr:unnamed protein product [Coregonus sp. 'balchen']
MEVRWAGGRPSSPCLLYLISDNLAKTDWVGTVNGQSLRRRSVHRATACPTPRWRPGVLEEEEAEGEDEEEEEGSLTEKSQDEAPESPSPITMVTPGAYEDEEEEAEEEEEATPLAMSYEHTRRCIEEDGGLLDQEALPSFPKGLDLHKANSGEEPPFDVKDIFNTASLESEALKETLYRQAKTQAYAMMLSLSENNPLHASSQNSLDAWLSMGGGPAETSSFYPLNHI